MRRWAIAALVVSVSTLSAVTSPRRPVQVVIEPVARTMVTSSPQTAGPDGELSWGLDRIDQRTVVSGARSYNFANDGTGVNIYILDSGVQASHPEFGGRVASGWSYRSSNSALTSYRAALAAYQSNPANGIEPCVNDMTHQFDPVVFDNPSTPDATDLGQTDNDGHGTHVAGIVAGDGVGVAKNATVIPVRALDSCGNGTRSMILEGLAWILADHDDGEKAALNLSVGFPGQVTEVDTAITALMNEGVLVSAAAGNSSTSSCSSTPASTPGTISTGAMTIADAESSYSNYGLCVDIFAPGSLVRSAYPYLNGTLNTYASVSGTSMASPFVTGAMARYLQLSAVAPNSFASGVTAFWNWLSANATNNAITYFNLTRSTQTPNRLLYVPSVPLQVRDLIALPADGSAVVSWKNVLGGATYTATATPGGASCSVVATETCIVQGLANGTRYTISVVGTNGDGSGPSAETQVTAGETPAIPATALSSTTSNAISLVWTPATTAGVTYIVTSSPASSGCVTAGTQCVISGLRNGVNYTFFIATQSITGLVSSSTTQIVARPGFTVKKTVVSKGSRTLLSSIVTTPSRGRKTWTESGLCSFSRGRLVAPRKKTTCTVRLQVAKSGAYPKMTTTLKVTVK